MARHGRIRPHDAILALQVLFQAALAVEPAETRVRVGTDPATWTRNSSRPGLTLGVLIAADLIPIRWAIGHGRYALLLGARVYGLALRAIGFFLPQVWKRLLCRTGVSSRLPWKQRQSAATRPTPRPNP